MNVSIEITPSKDLQGLFQRAASLPQESLKAIARALAVSGDVIISNALDNRFLQVPGPFPVDQHKLGYKSGFLRKSLFSTAPQIEKGSSTVTMGFGSRLKYFAIHEFGGTINRPARQQVNNFRFLADGKRVRFAKLKDATFSQKNQIGASSYQMPARAPMQTELRHPRTAEVILTLAEREILKVINEIEGGGA